MPDNRKLLGRTLAKGLLLLGGLCIPAAQSVAGTGAPWPAIYGQGGSFAVQTPQEIQDMAHDNLKLVLTSEFKTRGAIGAAMHQSGVKYIDDTIWNFLYWTKPALCSTPQHRCTNDPAAVQVVLKNVQDYLRQQSGNTDIVGFWVMDDYPGSNILPVLTQIHDLIRAVNDKSTIKRPAICGISTPQYVDDLTRAPGATFSAKFPYIAQTLTNYSPAACDMIGVYSYLYNRGDRPSQSQQNWTMSAILPPLLQELRRRGWDQNRQPMIGIPQAFHYPPAPSASETTVMPTAANMADQIDAFCRAGAIAILGFSWDDGGGPGRLEPYNTPVLRRGLAKGVDDCRQKYWTRK